MLDHLKKKNIRIIFMVIWTHSKSERSVCFHIFHGLRFNFFPLYLKFAKSQLYALFYSLYWSKSKIFDLSKTILTVIQQEMFFSSSNELLIAEKCVAATCWITTFLFFLYPTRLHFFAVVPFSLSKQNKIFCSCRWKIPKVFFVVARLECTAPLTQFQMKLGVIQVFVSVRID